jgi:hypothetical protein
MSWVPPGSAHKLLRAKVAAAEAVRVDEDEDQLSLSRVDLPLPRGSHQRKVHRRLALISSLEKDRPRNPDLSSLLVSAY